MESGWCGVGVQEAGKQRLPMLVCCYEKLSQSFLAVGHVGFNTADGKALPKYASPQRFAVGCVRRWTDPVRYSVFGECFRAVARRERIEMAHHFDHATAAVPAAALKRFLEQLDYAMEDLDATTTTATTVTTATA
jgi:hypothetical protein